MHSHFLFSLDRLQREVSSINKSQDRKNEALVNEEITASVVLVVVDQGNKLGEMSVQEGIKIAEEKGLQKGLSYIA